MKCTLFAYIHRELFKEGSVARNVCQVEGGAEDCAEDESDDEQKSFKLHSVGGTGVKIFVDLR